VTDKDRAPDPETPTELRAGRDRFLSEFSLALVGEADVPTFLGWAVGEIGRLLSVDRVGLFLFDGPPEEGVLAARASWSDVGIPPLPDTVVSDRTVGLTAALAGRAPVASADAPEDPALAPIAESLRRIGTRSLLAAPIVLDGAPRGFLSAATLRARREWSAEESAFLQAAARHLAGALKQVGLLEEMARQRDRLSILLDVAAAVQRSTTQEEVVRTALDGLRETLGFRAAIIALVTPAGDEAISIGMYADDSPESGKRELTWRRRIDPTGHGPREVTAQVLASGEAVVVDDIETDPRAEESRPFLRSLGVGATAVFPMRTGGRLVGVMAVGGPKATWDVRQDDFELLQSLADFVGVALAQRWATEALARAAREERALSEASRALLSRTSNRDVLLSQILDAVVHHFGQENCSLRLVGREEKTLSLFARRGDWTEAAELSTLSIDGPGLVAAAARSRTVLNVPDVSKDDRYLPGWSAAKSELAVPLLLDGEAVGVLDLQSSRPDAFSPEDERTLAAFAERAALALRLADVVRQLEERTSVLEAVTRATQLLNFRLHTPDVLSSVVEETSRAFPGAAGGVVYVANADGTALTIAAASGVGRVTQCAWESTPIPVGRLRCAGTAFSENRPVLVDVTGLDELVDGQAAEMRARARAAVPDPEIRQLMAVPIRVADHRLGVLEILSGRPGVFAAKDAETLGLLAEQAAIALRNARLVEELQRSNRLKDDFLANLSHEVRTPLTGIVGWAEVLLDSGPKDPASRRALEAILGQATTLSRMLTDLIDLSRIDNFGLEVRHATVRLSETIVAALDAVTPTAEKKGVPISCDIADGLPALDGDPARLQQVIWNLLTNAVKFSPPGRPVRLSAREAGDGGVELVVEDEGAGIDSAFLPHVFDRFRQEETSSSRRYGGLGVGLSIARAIVEAHGGRIDVESEGRDRGARFRVVFPPKAVVRSGAFRRAQLLGRDEAPRGGGGGRR
jgi:signal transduction histidine kinase